MGRKGDRMRYAAGQGWARVMVGLLLGVLGLAMGALPAHANEQGRHPARGRHREVAGRRAQGAVHAGLGDQPGHRGRVRRHSQPDPGERQGGRDDVPHRVLPAPDGLLRPPGADGPRAAARAAQARRAQGRDRGSSRAGVAHPHGDQHERAGDGGGDRGGVGICAQGQGDQPAERHRRQAPAGAPAGPCGGGHARGAERARLQRSCLRRHHPGGRGPGQRLFPGPGHPGRGRRAGIDRLCGRPEHAGIRVPREQLLPVLGGAGLRRAGSRPRRAEPLPHARQAEPHHPERQGGEVHFRG